MWRGFTPFKLRAWWFHSGRSLLWPVSCSSQLLMVHMTAASRGSFATTQSSSLSESCVWALSITLSEPILIRIPILSATNDQLKLFNLLPAKPGCKILSIFIESQAAWIRLFVWLGLDSTSYSWYFLFSSIIEKLIIMFEEKKAPNWILTWRGSQTFEIVIFWFKLHLSS